MTFGHLSFVLKPMGDNGIGDSITFVQVFTGPIQTGSSLVADPSKILSTTWIRIRIVEKRLFENLKQNLLIRKKRKETKFTSRCSGRKVNRVRFGASNAAGGVLLFD